MGKSTAAGFLRARNVPVVDTDELSRQLVQPGKPALLEIHRQFGDSILDSNGGLRRNVLAGIVFSDPDARQKLETILHPRIREAWLAQIEKWRLENQTLAVVVIPLLFETKAEAQFDKIVCVACSARSQKERLRARNWNAEQISQRIAAQMPVEQKIARSHFVVWTEGDLDSHTWQISRIFDRLPGWE